MWYGDEPDRPTRLPEASAPRIATVARYRDRRDNGRLRVACTHLDEHHAANRARSATQLADRLCGDEATVVLGDLNTGSEPAVFDALAAVGLRPAAETGFAAHRADRPGLSTGCSHLDHILVSPGLHVGEVVVTTPSMAASASSTASVPIGMRATTGRCARRAALADGDGPPRPRRQLERAPGGPSTAPGAREQTPAPLCATLGPMARRTQPTEPDCVASDASHLGGHRSLAMGAALLLAVSAACGGRGGIAPRPTQRRRPRCRSPTS